MPDVGGFNSMFPQLQGQGLTKTAYQSNVQLLRVTYMTLSDSTKYERWSINYILCRPSSIV